MLVSGLFIELTSKCNLICPYCYNSSSSENIEHLDFESLKIFIKHCSQNKGASVTLSGGEPFLYPHFDELLNWLIDKSYNVSIITNGTIVKRNQALYNKLVKNNVRFQLTLDSHIQAEHDKTRGQGNFDICTSLISDLRQQNSDLVKVRHNINYTNLNYLEEFIRFCNSMHIKKVQFAVIDCIGRGASYMRTNMLSVAELIRNAYDKLEALDKKYADMELVYKGIIDDSVCALCVRDEAEPLLIKLSYNGNVFPCQAFHDIEYSLGNIYSSDYDEMLSFSNIRKAISPTEINRNEMCAKCVLRTEDCIRCPALFASCNKSDACKAKLIGLLNRMKARVNQ